MTGKRSDRRENEFCRQVGALLTLLEAKRTALRSPGYSYSLHKQICRGERVATPQAVAALAGLLDQLLTEQWKRARQQPGGRRVLGRELGAFTWIRSAIKGGFPTVEEAKLAGLAGRNGAQPRHREVSIKVEGVLEGLTVADMGEIVKDLCAHLQGRRLKLTRVEEGCVQLTLLLSSDQCDRLRSPGTNGRLRTLGGRRVLGIQQESRATSAEAMLLTPDERSCARALARWR